MRENGTGEITVLHCTTEYPAPFSDVNLKAMLTIKKELGVKVGYSDHTKGIEASIAAVALGASVIEKHLTLDKNMEGPDHKSSLEPNEMKAMIRALRNIARLQALAVDYCVVCAMSTTGTARRLPTCQNRVAASK